MFTLRNQVRPFVAPPKVVPSAKVLAVVARMRALSLADAELARLIEVLEPGGDADLRLAVDAPTPLA